MDNTNDFWSNVSMAAVTPVAVAAGVAKGAFDATTDNGAFSDGFSDAASPIFNAAKNFGHQHGDTITKGVVTGAAGALGARILRGTLRHIF